MKKVIYRFTYDDALDFSVVFMNEKIIGRILRYDDQHWHYRAHGTNLTGKLFASRNDVKQSIEVLFDKE